MRQHKFDIEDKKDKVKEEILRIGTILKKTPTMKEYKKNVTNEVSSDQVLYIFGKWSEAIKFSGLKPNPFRKPPRNEISEKLLIDNFLKVSNELKRVPGKLDFGVYSKYSWGPYTRKWGSRKGAILFIIKNHSKKFNFKVQLLDGRKKEKFRVKELAYKCPLKYEPRNEFETIALFVSLCDELGYKIKRIRADFPDAILEKDGIEIETEFEYLSSNYQAHCHPVDEKYLCICWRKDKNIKGLKVIALEEYLRNKRRRS